MILRHVECDSTELEIASVAAFFGGILYLFFFFGHGRRRHPTEYLFLSAEQFSCYQQTIFDRLLEIFLYILAYRSKATYNDPVVPVVFSTMYSRLKVSGKLNRPKNMLAIFPV